MFEIIQQDKKFLDAIVDLFVCQWPNCSVCELILLFLESSFQECIPFVNHYVYPSAPIAQGNYRETVLDRASHPPKLLRVQYFRVNLHSQTGFLVSPTLYAFRLPLSHR